MAKNSKRKLFQYKEIDLKNALLAIKNGMKIKTASENFKVPRTTLRNKLKGRCTESFGKVGPKCVLGTETEISLVNWIKDCAKAGFPVDKDGLLFSVKSILNETKIKTPFKQNIPGKKWLHSFMKRHPDLSMKKAEYINKARATVTQQKIENWFKETEELLGEHTVILRDGNRVFNMDESAFYLNPEGAVVIAEKGKCVYGTSANSDKENVTVLVTVNANGAIAPPLAIYKFQRLPKLYIQKAPKFWSLGTSESGWMTAKNFYEYFANVFYPFLIENNSEFPIIVFLDGHSSHLSLQLSRFCREKQIIVVCLPPNTTHMMQPLDVAVFGPLKKNWRKSVRRFCFENGREIKKIDLPNILQEILNYDSTAQNIKSGFRKCGLLPFDSSAVDYTKCIQQVDRVLPMQENAKVENSDNTNHLTYLETFIDQRLLDEFRQCRESNQMPQDLRAEYLFEIWLKVIGDSNQVSNNSNNYTTIATGNDDEIVFDFPELKFTDLSDNIENLDPDQYITLEYAEENKKTDISEPLDNDKNKKINILSCVVLPNLYDNMKKSQILESNNETTSQTYKLENERISQSGADKEIYENAKCDIIETEAKIVNLSDVEKDGNMADLYQVDVLISKEGTSEETNFADNREQEPTLETNLYSKLNNESNIEQTVMDDETHCDNIPEKIVPELDLEYKNNESTKYLLKNKNSDVEYKDNELTKNLDNKESESEYKKGELTRTLENKDSTLNIQRKYVDKTQKSTKDILRNILVFPIKSDNLSEPKRKCKRIASPSVLTSDKWLEIAEKKEEEKKEKEKLKQMRKIAKEQNKRKKMEKGTDEMNRKKIAKANSDENKPLSKTDKENKRQEEETLHNIPEKREIKPGSYVIVTYDGKYYPGKVKKTIKPINEFVVSTMEKSGVKDWKWPEEKDEITYKEEDVICLIKEPLLKTQRGAYSVPEMENFDEFTLF